MEYRQLGASGALGRLTGKIRHGSPPQASSRLHETESFAPPVAEQRLDAASAVLPPYPHAPYHYQAGFARLNPAMIATGGAWA